MKPFKGTIHDWYKLHFDRNMYPQFKDTLGFMIVGTPSGHPFLTNWIRTSVVVKHEGDMIETMNSRYRLGNPKEEVIVNGIQYPSIDVCIPPCKPEAQQT